jgi:WD40 repeat protein
MSDQGDYIASGSYHNIYIFNRSSSTPVFNYNLETQLVDTGVAGPLDLTSGGSFIVACASRNDSSWIMGFQRTSTTPVWRYRVGQTLAGGAGIQGIKISGNDSLVIVNTYLGVYVFRTFTGQLMYSGTVNPTNNNGTQSQQGISGNGNIIATINYIGFVRVLQWNGSTYNLLWQHQEPPGTYYNWMTAVDVSYDGSMVACGTLNFITSSTYDGKVKLFRTTTGSTPIWTYAGAGDEITCVSFSKNGNILAASSWGDLSNTTYDLMVFKISTGVNVPIYQLNTAGSFFWCSTSNDGSTVVSSGKKVHARQFGNGGEVYNVFIDTNDSPLGIQPVSNNEPGSYNLLQNYPNPFNPSTQIEFQIPASSYVKLTVYNALGEEISVLVKSELNRGTYKVSWDASGKPSGIYFYKIETAGYSKTLKMILIK